MVPTHFCLYHPHHASSTMLLWDLVTLYINTHSSPLVTCCAGFNHRFGFKTYLSQWIVIVLVD